MQRAALATTKLMELPLLLAQQILATADRAGAASLEKLTAPQAAAALW
jgi:hypothetical protein